MVCCLYTRETHEHMAMESELTPTAKNVGELFTQDGTLA